MLIGMIKTIFCKGVNRKGGLGKWAKIYMREGDAEGTGYEPPALALRLDTPVIVYWDYIILDKLVDYIFREVFA